MDTMQTEPATGGKGGSSLAIIIVILIIALGGAYFWYGRAGVAPQMNSDAKNAKTVSDEQLQKDLEASGNVDVSADMNGLDQVYK